MTCFHVDKTDVIRLSQTFVDRQEGYLMFISRREENYRQLLFVRKKLSWENIYHHWKDGNILKSSFKKEYTTAQQGNFASSYNEKKKGKKLHLPVFFFNQLRKYYDELRPRDFIALLLPAFRSKKKKKKLKKKKNKR